MPPNKNTLNTLLLMKTKSKYEKKKASKEHSQKKKNCLTLKLFKQNERTKQKYKQVIKNSSKTVTLYLYF